MVNQKVMGLDVIERFEVVSNTGNKTYVVCLLEKGNYSCGCSNWIFRRNKPNYTECKHIQQIRKQIDTRIQ